jgi:hypothetical protein
MILLLHCAPASGMLTCMLIVELAFHEGQTRILREMIVTLELP